MWLLIPSYFLSLFFIFPCSGLAQNCDEFYRKTTVTISTIELIVSSTSVFRLSHASVTLFEVIFSTRGILYGK